ncbi:MAG: hypothetical protein NC182_00075 [Prevotella sp.]|nr:hypothetical protein [Staphylococcus sp.]MCM1349581.1 hypothetical protein [Prevotella sp.]
MYVLEENKLYPSGSIIDFYFENFNRNLIDYGYACKKSNVRLYNQINRSCYFENLHRNIGNNANGSCSYVASGTLLSYYDTFYNDKIVPNTYMDEEREESLHMFDNEIERIKQNKSLIPSWYQKNS